MNINININIYKIVTHSSEDFFTYATSNYNDK